ncbi:GNAT family N-acetyltransferase [Terrilactibacillus sp. S3-3]|nr:GNAT family N-acetyltransferase [Terrilactibacillus sp. S3-3]
MLIRYKKSYEKIAMGLLSFVPSEKDLKKLRQTMKRYEEDDDWQLYLWKQGDDIIGEIGVHLDQNEAFIEHISVNPSYRSEGIGHKIIQSLNNILGNEIHLTPSAQTKSFFDVCFNLEKKS